MTTPPGIKNIHRNCTWKDADEKLAFFNHYFKKGNIADDYCKNNIQAYGQRILGFIERNEIIEGKNKRPITIKDIQDFIKKEGA